MEWNNGCCCRQPTEIFSDYYDRRPNIAFQFQNAFQAFPVVPRVVHPSTQRELNECKLYTIGCWGREPDSEGAMFPLSRVVAEVVAEWVHTRPGKLLITVDYRTFFHAPPTLPTKAIHQSYYEELSTLIGLAGGDLVFGAEDSSYFDAVDTPWPLGTFFQTEFANGIVTPFEYDASAGSSITGSTIDFFSTNPRNSIKYQRAGNGHVLCFGSQNTLWGNLDRAQSAPTNFEAMNAFLNAFYHL